MRSLQGERIDMAEWTQYFAFDVLSELSFGDWFGNLDSASDKDELGHWVFLTLTGTAVLGWTWLQSAAIGFHPVQWLLNKSLYARAGTQITRNPLKEVLNVSDQMEPFSLAFEAHHIIFLEDHRQDAQWMP